MFSTPEPFFFFFLSPLSQVLWLLSFDDKNTLADAVDKYCIGVPPIQWLAWIPQLLTCLVGSEGKPLLNLISQVCTFIILLFYYDADVALGIFCIVCWQTQARAWHDRLSCSIKQNKRCVLVCCLICRC